MYARVYVYIHIFMYIHVCVYMCVHMCVCISMDLTYDSLHLGWTLNASIIGIESNTIRLDKGGICDLHFCLIW